MTKVLLVTCDEGAGHNWAATSPAIEEVLSRDFELTTVRTLQQVKDSGDLRAGFSAIVLHGFFGRDPEVEERLERFVHGGGGLAVVHIASGSFEGSARFRRLVGRVWEYGYSSPPFTSNHPPRGSFRVDVTPAGHPITEGLASFDVEDDERYEDLLIAPDTEIHILAEATLQGRTEPVAWIVLPPQGGRVFHLTLGHDGPTYRNKAFQGLLLKGVEWTSGQHGDGADRQDYRGGHDEH